jgi:3-oxoadipate enol-lactonase
MPAQPLVLAHEVHAPQHADTVVLLHSLALDRRVWRPVVGALAESRTVVVVDLRGHGESADDADFTVEDMADDVARTMAELGRDRAAVVGMSMGGSVAQAVAIRHPDRVGALGLIDTTAYYGPDAVSAWAERADKARAAGLRSLADFQLTRWFSDDFRAGNGELCRELLDVFMANDIDSYTSACRALGAMDLRDGLAAVSVPTTILVGEDDPATPPAHAADLHARIRGSVKYALPGARHLTPVEQPDVVLQHLKVLLG